MSEEKSHGGYEGPLIGTRNPSSSPVTRVGPVGALEPLGGGSSLTPKEVDEAEKRRKKFFESLKKYKSFSEFGTRIPGMNQQTLTLPGERGRFVGTFSPFDDEGGVDKDNGYWSWRQDLGNEPFYDPTLPPGYKAPRGQQMPQANQMGMEALLALLAPQGSPNVGRGRPTIGGTRYANSAPMDGYSRFLGG